MESFKRVDLVTLAGRVDSNSASQLDSTLKSLLENGRYKIVLELSGVSYLSSAGLRTMVSAVRESKKHRGDVRLANVSGRVDEVLKLAGLNAIFQVYEDKTSAVGSY